MPKLVAHGLTRSEFENLRDADLPTTPLHYPLGGGSGDARTELMSRGTQGVIIVMLCFLLEALTLSSRSYFAVCLEMWEDEFSVSRTAVSSCRALQLVAQSLATPVAGQLSDSFPRLTLCFGLVVVSVSLLTSAAATRSWHLFVAYGLLGGVGFGFTNFNVAAAMLTRVVPERRLGLATGIATTGGPVGQMVLVPVFQLVAVAQGWRAGFIVTSAAILTLVPLAFILLDLRLSGSDKSTDEKGKTGSLQTGSLKETASPLKAEALNEEAHLCMKSELSLNDKESHGNADGWTKLRGIVCQRWFVAVALPFFICGITAVGVIETHLIAVATSRGIAADTAAFSFGVLMLANGCGKNLLF